MDPLVTSADRLPGLSGRSQPRLRALTIGLTLSTAMLGLPGITPWPGIPIAAAQVGKPNACGCYRDSSGSCFCGKRTKCGCPGECEPKGCEEKRDKQLRKEIEAETRKAREEGRKHSESRNAARPEPEPKREREREDTVPSARPKPKRPVVKLTAPQRKEFLRLLDIYISEDPDHRGQTMDQVRTSVRAARD